MKVTIDIPDDLYRRVKARAALAGLKVREVTTELYREWLGERPGSTRTASPDEWLTESQQLGHAALSSVPDGPTGTALIAEDRSRLDRRR